MSAADDPSASSPTRLPSHVAIIMDGNGRWARRRLMPRFVGHKAGVEAVRNIVVACRERGIGALTLFAFSSENWQRPEEEVGLLMDLFSAALEREVGELQHNNVRVCFIGDRSAFGPGLTARIERAERATAANDGLLLSIAANYGGRWDITQAVKALCGQVQRGELGVADIDERRLAGALELANLPEPDLFIRTGGEQRISNFLLWQLAYTELYFTATLWPDFDRQAFDQALGWYAQRERRFGRTSEQLRQLNSA
ncbi:MAG: isoprenyl transferase [Gammaproteobacteria bacterium]|nr:isoprenyl transferase [Gammaproteobacteria bacterium]